MRTATICPTCAKYENAICVIYTGDYLPITDIQPSDSVQTALQKIEAAIDNSGILGTSGTSGSSGIAGSSGTSGTSSSQVGSCIYTYKEYLSTFTLSGSFYSRNIVFPTPLQNTDYNIISSFTGPNFFSGFIETTETFITNRTVNGFTISIDSAYISNYVIPVNQFNDFYCQISVIQLGDSCAGGNGSSGQQYNTVVAYSDLENQTNGGVLLSYTTGPEDAHYRFDIIFEIISMGSGSLTSVVNYTHSDGTQSEFDLDFNGGYIIQNTYGDHISYMNLFAKANTQITLTSTWSPYLVSSIDYNIHITLTKIR